MGKFDNNLVNKFKLSQASTVKKPVVYKLFQ